VPSPNFLLIMTDQQRADSVGFAHPAKAEGTNASDTPFLDDLAGRGIVFDNAYSASTVCVPSRSSLLTGLFDTRLPRGPDGLALKEGYWTIAHALAAAGYETGLFGKMHFSPIDARHGFNVVRSCEHLTRSAGYSPNDSDGYRRWLTGLGLADPREDGMRLFPYSAELHPTQWITDQAIQFLKNRNSSRPFFAVVSYTSPHSPIDPPEPYAALYEPGSQILPADGFEVNEGLPSAFLQAFLPTPADVFAPVHVSHRPTEETQVRLAWVRALVRQIDDRVAELMAHVSLEDTIVFFTSDHGDFGGHRGMLGKVPWIPFDDLSKVPLLCVGARVQGARRVAEPVQSCDFALTCLELAGLRPPAPDFDTESLARVLVGAPAREDRAVYSALSMGWPMIRKAKFKYFSHWLGEQMLYDLEADPGETTNVVEAHPHVAQKLSNELSLQLQRPMLDLWVSSNPTGA
jgi:arylsulfatase A-like enzyme